ncbi:hypothetical protein [Pedobacter duraquae]|uniref:Uncharacterized protein n=1 Tax=Pedobacter duraquae TaxID=425511 RepID=A0A4R6IPR4_9SPHI|nr:hypothetical protein [Pedobacter duraquae]TDO24290.1 hypothetical protein CLV32_0579 [Pedobacter duraquae]
MCISKFTKNLVFFACILLASCQGEPKIIGDSPLKLDNIDFNFNVVKFYDDSALFNGKKDIIIRKEVEEDGDWGAEKPVNIQYHQVSYSSDHILAKFEGLSCYGLNMVTTMDNKLMVISAVVSEMSKDESDDFIAAMTKKYGKSQKRENTFIELKYPIYRWELKDRVLQYSPVFNDESNTIKLEADGNDGKLKAGKPNPHYKGYIYITKKQYEKQVFGTLHSGDFVFYDRISEE